MKNQKKKGKKLFLSIMLSASILLPFGYEIAHASASTSTYIIKSGDTLYSISKKHHTTVDKLKKINGLNNNNINIGKKLVVPFQSTTTKPTQTQTAKPTQTTNSNYNPKIPMKKEHQLYLYKMTKERGLDYKKTLALIQTESTFKPNARGGNNYGLMQINKVNHASLTKKLKTANKPYDPYVNMNWGTYMLADLYKYWEGRGLTGAKLDQYVWSSYNRGLGGAKKYGLKTSYVNKMNSNIKYIKNLYN